MQIEGDKRLIKRAVYAARLLDVWEFNLNIDFGDDNYCIRHDDGTFTIRIDKVLHKSLFIDMVAHEMVHLRQYKHDILRAEGNVVFWNGEPHLLCQTLDDAYWLSPWEMEARALQDWIAYRWGKRKNELH
jgi:hypothetical protein